MKQTIIILLLLITIISCTQDEFMPSPYGEKVPYEDLKKEELDKVLTGSQRSLFLLALEKSTINSLLQEEWKNLSLTFLVPSDAAFEEAGLTEDKLKNMSTVELDTIIMYHTLSDKIDTANVKSTYGNIRMKSKLENKNSTQGNDRTYTYLHYLSITDKQILINGNIVGDYRINQAIEADVIFIDKYLEKPEKTLWQTMKEDSRLSIFMQIVEANDALYQTSSWDPIYIPQMREAVMQPQLDATYSGQNRILNGLTSVFAPTNEAFTKAGYQSAEEFLHLNEPNWMYRGQFLTFSGGAPYNFRTFHKTDSILTYHHGWGQRYYPTDGGAGGFSTVFFSNDLTDEYLGDYILQLETSSPNNQPRMTCPYTFSRENGKIKMQLKNAKEGTEPATIIEQDILTLNGPLYIVDRLFIPNHF